MSNFDLEVGKFRPEETIFYNEVHKAIEDRAGKMTPAEVNGILFQISLEMLGVFEYA